MLEAACLLMHAKTRSLDRTFTFVLHLDGSEPYDRLKRRLEKERSNNVFHRAEEPDDQYDFSGHIKTGFQLATFQGPLCAEPMDGLAFFVENVEIDANSVQMESGGFYICIGTLLDR